MKIAVIGASGFLGSAIISEALNRNHQVTAIARNPEKIGSQSERLNKVRADVFNEPELVAAVSGHDAVISAYNPGWTNPNIFSEFLDGARAIQEAVKKAGVGRFLIVGGAGSLYVDPQTQLIDTPAFPQEYKAGAEAARQYLEILKDEKELDWTFLSPAIEMHPGTSGQRKGSYRPGLDEPVFNEQGRSVISVEDLAFAILDEIENSKHSRRRFTVAY